MTISDPAPLLAAAAPHSWVPHGVAAAGPDPDSTTAGAATADTTSADKARLFAPTDLPLAICRVAAPHGWSRVQSVLLACDAVAITAAVVTAAWVDAHGGSLPAHPGDDGGLPGRALLIAAWCLAIALSEGYDRRVVTCRSRVRRVLIRASWWAVSGTALLSCLLPGLPLTELPVTMLLGTGLLLAGRALTRRLTSDLARRPGLLVVGSDPAVRRLGHRLQESSLWRVVGSCETSAGHGVVAAAVQTGAEAVLVGDWPEDDHRGLRWLGRELGTKGIELIVTAALAPAVRHARVVRTDPSVRVVWAGAPDVAPWARGVKRVVDAAGAAGGLVLLAPLLVAIAIAVRVSSPGPALFRQRRVGRFGRPFAVVKFRTMFVDAEQRLAALRSSNESDGLLFKMRHDPRVTPLGALLRRTSLDELPQLWNVLVGQMSLVGPRPLPVQDESFTGEVRERLLVRPGITGLWQVSGRSQVTWEQAVQLDLRYVREWSMAMDARILVRTASAVLRGDGAY